jgi:hypothetical protein
MPSQIEDQIRVLVDIGAPPITLAEVDALRAHVAPRRRSKRPLVVVAIAALILLVVVIVLSSGDDGSQSVRVPPAQSSNGTTPLSVHLAPADQSTVQSIALNVDSGPEQPKVQHVRYEGTFAGQPVSLYLSAARSDSGPIPFRPPGDPTCRDAETNSGQPACLLRVQDTWSAGWSETDGLSIVITGSATIDETTFRTLVKSVERPDANSDEVELTPTPPWLRVTDRGGPPSDTTTGPTQLVLASGACTFVLSTEQAQPGAAPLPGSVPITVRGASGYLVGSETIQWTAEGTTYTLGSTSSWTTSPGEESTPPPVQSCDPQPVAESLVQLDSDQWTQLLDRLGDKVQR